MIYVNTVNLHGDDWADRDAIFRLGCEVKTFTSNLILERPTIGRTSYGRSSAAPLVSPIAARSQCVRRSKPRQSRPDLTPRPPRPRTSDRSRCSGAPAAGSRGGCSPRATPSVPRLHTHPSLSDRHTYTVCILQGGVCIQTGNAGLPASGAWLSVRRTRPRRVRSTPLRAPPRSAAALACSRRWCNSRLSCGSRGCRAPLHRGTRHRCRLVIQSHYR